MKFVTFSLKERPFNKIAIKPEDICRVTENVTEVCILIKHNDTFVTIPVAETFSEVIEILNGGDTDDTKKNTKFVKIPIAEIISEAMKISNGGDTDGQ